MLQYTTTTLNKHVNMRSLTDPADSWNECELFGKIVKLWCHGLPHNISTTGIKSKACVFAEKLVSIRRDRELPYFKDKVMYQFYTATDAMN